MHIIVLGSGVIGTTLAYYLAKKGAQVTVIERAEGAGLETSFANAGQLSFGYSNPWAAPGVQLKAVKWLFQKHAPLAIRPTANMFQYWWMLQMAKNCNKKSYHLNKLRLVRISEYSRHSIDQLREEAGISFEERQLGLMQLLRTEAQMEAIKEDIEVLEEYKVPYKVLDRDEIVATEPGLKDSVHKLVGALRLPNDQTGDCYLFTKRLAEMAEELGATFKYNQTVEEIVQENGQIKGVKVAGELLTADHYSVCLGSYTHDLVKSLGVKAPIYPFKGYSITVPIQNEEKAPQSTVLDESYKIAITRFDNRIRVGGMAEIMGHNLSLNPKRRKTLEMVVEDLYPGAGNIAKAEFWTGLRPSTPDSTPIIGKTKYDNLSINAGHGTLGWTMATGSGNYLSDIILGNTPEIETEGLDNSRYR